MIAYFDTIGGISGDMTLGALVGAGVPFDHLRTELTKLNLDGFELEASHVERSGITATKVDVIVSQQPSYHRHLKDINAIIDKSSLSSFVKESAKAMFLEVARAEATVHNSEIEKIHFHEVGAVDSIVDLVGTAICLESLKVDAVYSSPIKVGGGGFVKSAHGNLPIPTPATMEILRDYPVVLTEIHEELATPTGAAIIKSLSKGMLSASKLNVSSIGYGAGTKEIQGIPNLLRVMVGTTAEGFEIDETIVIETNIDDMNPEIYPYVIEQLIENGAHDAFVVPILMKKGRPGILLSTIVERGRMDHVLQVLFRETTTLGVRILPVDRRKVRRSQRDVRTSLGLVRVKVVDYNGSERLIPEFEECKRIAKEKNLPLKDVYKIVEREIEG